jgi:hypothetical protein
VTGWRARPAGERGQLALTTWWDRKDTNFLYYFSCRDIRMLFLMLTMHHDCNNNVINCFELLFLGATKGRKAAGWLRNLGMGQYIATNKKTPVYFYSLSHAVKFKFKCTHLLNMIVITGETLEDYPDSPGLGTDLTAEAGATSWTERTRWTPLAQASRASSDTVSRTRARKIGDAQQNGGMRTQHRAVTALAPLRLQCRHCHRFIIVLQKRE